MAAPQGLTPLEKTSLRTGYQSKYAVAGFMEVLKYLPSNSESPSSSTSTSTSSSSSNSSSTPITSTMSPLSPSNPISQSLLIQSESLRGRIVVYGDSYCFEQQSTVKAGCKNLLSSFFDYVDSGTIKIPEFNNSKNNNNLSSQELSFEFLKKDEFFERNLMDSSRKLSKTEMVQLDKERKARMWEFSRSEKIISYYFFSVYSCIFFFSNQFFLFIF